jgi:hypothetical protein
MEISNEGRALGRFIGCQPEECESLRSLFVTLKTGRVAGEDKQYS